MSSSSKKSTVDNSTTNQNQTSNDTMSNNQTQVGISGTLAPDWLTSGYQNLFQQANSLAGVDPSTTVAGLNSTQTGAINSAQNLGSNQGLFSTAEQLALAGASGGANTAQGVNLGAAQTYAGTSPVTAAQAGGVTIDPITQAAASQISTADIQRLMNPYINDVVNTTLASSDANDAAQRAQLEAQGAAAGAFGGSRFGVAQGTLEAAQGLNRAQTEAGLRSDAYNSALSGATTDAGFAEQSNLANAAAANARAIAQANLTSSNNQFNTGQTNSVALSNADRDQQAGLFNAGAINDRTTAQGQLTQANNQFNASAADTAAGRQLTAAGLFGNLGSAMGDSQRADIASQLQAGQVQQTTEQAQKNAALSYLSQLGGLFGEIPTNLFTQQYTGQNVQGTSTDNKNAYGTTQTNGTSTTTSTPSGLDTAGRWIGMGASLFG